MEEDLSSPAGSATSLAEDRAAVDAPPSCDDGQGTPASDDDCGFSATSLSDMKEAAAILMRLRPYRHDDVSSTVRLAQTASTQASTAPTSPSTSDVSVVADRAEAVYSAGRGMR